MSFSSFSSSDYNNSNNKRQKLSSNDTFPISKPNVVGSAVATTTTTTTSSSILPPRTSPSLFLGKPINKYDIDELEEAGDERDWKLSKQRTGSRGDIISHNSNNNNNSSGSGSNTRLVSSLVVAGSGRSIASHEKSLRLDQQIVTDEAGRRRFHGSFTGGFSAGYFNTVGSKEGWKPSTFVSSRTSRVQQVEQSPQEFMDEEDLENIASSGSLIQTAAKKGGVVRGGSGDKDETNLYINEDGGTARRILRSMGWREGTPIGGSRPRRTPASIKSISNKNINNIKRVLGPQRPTPPSEVERNNSKEREGEGEGGDHLVEEEEKWLAYRRECYERVLEACKLLKKFKFDKSGVGYKYNNDSNNNNIVSHGNGTGGESSMSAIPRTLELDNTTTRGAFGIGVFEEDEGFHIYDDDDDVDIYRGGSSQNLKSQKSKKEFYDDYDDDQRSPRRRRSLINDSPDSYRGDKNINNKYNDPQYGGSAVQTLNNEDSIDKYMEAPDRYIDRLFEKSAEKDIYIYQPNEGLIGRHRILSRHIPSSFNGRHIYTNLDFYRQPTNKVVKKIVEHLKKPKSSSDRGSLLGLTPWLAPVPSATAAPPFSKEQTNAISDPSKIQSNRSPSNLSQHPTSNSFKDDDNNNKSLQILNELSLSQPVPLSKERDSLEPLWKGGSQLDKKLLIASLFSKGNFTRGENQDMSFGEEKDIYTQTQNNNNLKFPSDMPKQIRYEIFCLALEGSVPSARVYEYDAVVGVEEGGRERKEFGSLYRSFRALHPNEIITMSQLPPPPQTPSSSTLSSSSPSPYLSSPCTSQSSFVRYSRNICNWQPSRLLCKRLGLKEPWTKERPFVDDSRPPPVKKTLGIDVFDRRIDNIIRPKDENISKGVERSDRSNNSKDINSNNRDSTQSSLDGSSKTNKRKNEFQQTNDLPPPPEKPPISIFKAVFGSDDDQSSDEED